MITDGDDSCTIILVFGIGLLVLTFEVKTSKNVDKSYLYLVQEYNLLPFAFCNHLKQHGLKINSYFLTSFRSEVCLFKKLHGLT